VTTKTQTQASAEAQIITARVCTTAGPRIIALLRRQFRNTAHVEEAVQDALLALHVQLRDGADIAEPGGWVYIVAQRKLLDQCKRAAVSEHVHAVLAHASPFDPRPLPDEVLEDEARRTVLRQALAVLSPIEAQVLHLRLQGLKLREIGDATGMDLRRASEVIERAIGRLKATVEEAS
jgi:RNA polymerase sigma-70 factor, ECF subfamily